MPITSVGYMRPGLLSTCKQVAHEATTTWYEKNMFSLIIASFDSQPGYNFLDGLQKSGWSCRVHIWCQTAVSTLNWSNLVLWLKRFYMRTVGFRVAWSDEDIGWSHNYTIAHSILAGMFDTAHDFRSIGLPWDVVERAVIMQRGGLIATDSRWAK